MPADPIRNSIVWRLAHATREQTFLAGDRTELSIRLPGAYLALGHPERVVELAYFEQCGECWVRVHEWAGASYARLTEDARNYGPSWLEVAGAQAGVRDQVTS